MCLSMSYINLSDEIIYTYMGVLKPNLGNANYCSAGQLSPLLNDPYYKTIGVGTRIFLGGGVGYVVWQGTQVVSRLVCKLPETLHWLSLPIFVNHLN